MKIDYKFNIGDKAVYETTHISDHGISKSIVGGYIAHQSQRDDGPLYLLPPLSHYIKEEKLRKPTDEEIKYLF